ncbi:MAG: 50S ribosomal protein L32 [Candidatus Peregrinibacteria bacterium]
MAKHPVPKKKTPKSKGKKRYGAFKTRTLKALTDRVKLTTCKNCGAAALAHTACPQCGQYKGRQVIDKQKALEKITKIKA